MDTDDGRTKPPRIIKVKMSSLKQPIPAAAINNNKPNDDAPEPTVTATATGDMPTSPSSTSSAKSIGSNVSSDGSTPKTTGKGKKKRTSKAKNSATTHEQASSSDSMKKQQLEQQKQQPTATPSTGDGATANNSNLVDDSKTDNDNSLKQQQKQKQQKQQLVTNEMNGHAEANGQPNGGIANDDNDVDMILSSKQINGFASLNGTIETPNDVDVAKRRPSPTTDYYCVDVAKLCSAFAGDDVSSDGASIGSCPDEPPKRVVVTGVSLKTLKNQYVNQLMHESVAMTTPQPAIRTGIDIKTLKNSYVLTASDDVASKNALNKELITTGVNINSLKWSFNSEQVDCSNNYNNRHQLSNSNTDLDRIATGISVKSLKSTFNNNNNNIHAINNNTTTTTANSNQMDDGVRVDKAKVQKKFAQVIDESSVILCKVCGKTVYQMEKIVAEKNAYHRTCFRCKECNKQLSVDSYSSHESLIYCKAHFKSLFQPKARLEDDDPKPTRRRYEMIIRENVPEELPPDVVRYDQKVEDPLDNLQLDLSNIRLRFEQPKDADANSQPPPERTEKTGLKRAESIKKMMQKYQSAASGQKVDSSSASSSDAEDDSNQKESEKIVFSGIASSLKSQWEQVSSSAQQQQSTPASTSAAKEVPEVDAKIEELASLRQQVNSDALKQAFERAARGESTAEAIKPRLSDPVIESPSFKTESIKEMFERGQVDGEGDRIDRLKKEREEELSLFKNETETASKEARNKFKRIDSTTKEPTTPPVNGQHNGHSFKHQVNGHSPKSPPPEVIKCTDPNVRDDDFSAVQMNQLQDRFKYFENYKEQPRQPKRHQITPPRDTKTVVESNNNEVPPEVVRSIDVVDDLPKADTAKKMLNKFKALENNNKHSNDNNSQTTTGPKPMKRITPPKEYTVNNDPDEDGRDPSPERDPNIIRSSYKSAEEIPVEPEKARSLRAKFENWSADIDRENRKNSSIDDDTEFVPHIDTTKNLRAKFEMINKEEANSKPVEKPQKKINRFVLNDAAPSDLCSVCNVRIYPMEKLEFSGLKLHKNCFRCFHCASALRLDNYTVTAGQLYCLAHFKQLFMARGNYDEGFGREQHKDKWMHKSQDGQAKSNGSSSDVSDDIDYDIEEDVDDHQHNDNAHHQFAQQLIECQDD